MSADLDKISEQIIGATFRVSNVLGVGFLEKVYENALVHELKKRGLLVEQQKRVTIYYDGVVVGDYYSDLLGEGLIIVELKAVSRIENIGMVQKYPISGNSQHHPPSFPPEACGNDETGVTRL